MARSDPGNRECSDILQFRTGSGLNCFRLALSVRLARQSEVIRIAFRETGMRQVIRRTALVAMLAGCATLLTPTGASLAGTRIVDACSFITGWEPARLRCYDMWMRWCPLIGDADARASCTAVLQAAKAGLKPPSADRGNGRTAKAEGKDQKAPGKQSSVSSSDAESGVTTTSVRNADGSRTVTVTDASGKVLDTHVVPARAPASASATDPATGITTKSVRNDDGSRTVTRTDADGSVLSSHVVPATAPDEASATDQAGTTTRSVRNPDGSRTVTVTDSSGKALSTKTYPPSKDRKAAEPKPEKPKPNNPAPRGARTLSDFCTLVGDPAARENCYGFGAMVKTVCQLIGDPNGKSECIRITATMPDRIGPFDE